MKTPEEWNKEFRYRVACAVGAGVSYDMNEIIRALCEDVQNDALGWEAVVRKRYGIVTRAEAEMASVEAVQEAQVV